MVSFFNFVDFMLIVVLAGLWAFLPNDGIAMVATWFKNKVVQVCVKSSILSLYLSINLFR